MSKLGHDDLYQGGVMYVVIRLLLADVVHGRVEFAPPPACYCFLDAVEDGKGNLHLADLNAVVEEPAHLCSECLNILDDLFSLDNRN